jgi:TonB family protein
MTGELSMLPGANGGPRRLIAGPLLGTAFTLVLFVGLAWLKHNAPEALPSAEFMDLPAVAAPIDAPPPLPDLAPPETAAPAAEVAGFDAGDTSSPVKVSLALPDISKLLPIHTTAPSLKVLNRVLPADLRPRMDLATEVQRIYQQSEVDQRPKVLSESNPFIPPVVRRGASQLRVTLLFVIDTNGTVESVRILESSGNAPFDEIVADCIKAKWVFTPAIRHSKRVKCMVQRAIIVNWKLSPFES